MAEQWAVYKAAVLVSRLERKTIIEAARAEYAEAVDPLREELRAQVEALGEEPEDGPRFSEQASLQTGGPTSTHGTI